MPSLRAEDDSLIYGTINSSERLIAFTYRWRDAYHAFPEKTFVLLEHNE